MLLSCRINVSNAQTGYMLLASGLDVYSGGSEPLQAAWNDRRCEQQAALFFLRARTAFEAVQALFIVLRCVGGV